MRFSLFSSVMMVRYSRSLFMRRTTIRMNLSPASCSAVWFSQRSYRICWRKSWYCWSPRPPSTKTSSLVIISFSNS
uniref:Putative secreted protein n=1 Tax=Ixodes ricinus TaxID=34613 RepID=A0A6B0TU15_IXORI